MGLLHREFGTEWFYFRLETFFPDINLIDTLT